MDIENLSPDEVLCSYVPPSKFTRRNSRMSDKELSMVLYDEPPHWFVAMILFFNPFTIFNEIPDEQNQKLTSRADRFLTALIRAGFKLAGILLALGVVACLLGTIGTALALAFPHVAPSIPTYLRQVVLWLPADVLCVVLLAAWGAYANKLRHQNHFVMTHESLTLIIRQLPFRPETSPTVPIDTFTQFDEIKPILGRLLRYSHVVIKTSETQEPIEARMYVKNKARLTSLLAAQRLHNQEEGMHLTGQVSRRNISNSRRGRPGTGPGR